MKTIALIIAGGSGNRMQQDIPKQFITVREKPVVIYSMEAFQKHPNIDVIAVVCIAGWENILLAYAKQFNITKFKHIVPGGENRQTSIRNGLFELEKYYDADDIILVHDGNRPLVSHEVISDCISTTEQFQCGIAALPCTDAMVETQDGIISIDSFPRDRLRRTQSPNGFYLGRICNLHRRALEAGVVNSIACCTMMIELGEQVHFSAGSEKNLKLTTIEDLDIFKALLTLERTDSLKREV